MRACLLKNYLKETNLYVYCAQNLREHVRSRVKRLDHEFQISVKLQRGLAQKVCGCRRRGVASNFALNRICHHLQK
jgi:hypothetical protein